MAILVVAQTGAALPPGRLPPAQRLLAPGPYALIFALFALFHGKYPAPACACPSCAYRFPYTANIPKMHPKFFSLCGLNFSDKSFYYLLGAQVKHCSRSHNFGSTAVSACY
jgi:hypothetical protein